MCRMFACMTDEPARLPCAVIDAQAVLLKKPPEGGARGWGVAGYDGQQSYPMLVRHLGAASSLWGPRHFADVEQFHASAWVTQVREGTCGAESTLNAPPFVFDQWTFAQVGSVPCYARLRAGMEMEIDQRHWNCRLGDTDSELLFYWLLSRLERVDSEDWASALEAAQAELVERARLCDHNQRPQFAWVLTDGWQMFAGCWHWTLFHRYGKAEDGPVYEQSHGVSAVPLTMAAISTEPLPGDHWTAFPARALLYASVQQGIDFRRPKAATTASGRRKSSVLR